MKNQNVYLNTVVEALKDLNVILKLVGTNNVTYQTHYGFGELVNITFTKGGKEIEFETLFANREELNNQLEYAGLKPSQGFNVLDIYEW